MRRCAVLWSLWLSAFSGCDCGVRFTVPQRSEADVPGFEGRVRVVVGDIKRGSRATLTIKEKGGGTVGHRPDVVPTQKVSFTVDGREYAIRVIDYEDHTFRDDLAHLAVLGLSEAQKASAARGDEPPSNDLRQPVAEEAPAVPLAELPLVAPAPLPVGPNTCGLRQPTIAERIADCERVRKGEGPTHPNWRLVSRTAMGLEVWRHQTTGLLWSDGLGGHADSEVSWCRAHGERTRSWRGNCEPSSTRTADEPSFATPQVDPPESWCAELPGFVTPTWLDEAKGGMRRLATTHSPSVGWALPSADEWKVARDDGATSVVPRAAELTFWTTSAAQQGLWTVAMKLVGARGNIDTSDLAPVLSVRCVGRSNDVTWAAPLDAGPEDGGSAGATQGW